MISNLNISSKKDLERAFAEDFSSPVLTILGELYLKNKDFHRAEKVCKVGLQHDPANINGYYILAKVYLCNNQLNKAEKILVQLIEKKPLHINALKLIITVQEELNVSDNSKLKYLKKLFNIFPDDKNLETLIVNIDKKYINKKKNISTQNKSKTMYSESNVVINPNFNIKPSMATLTFVEILKEQKHYNEALHVLSLFESTKAQNKQTKKLKSELQKLLSELQ